VKRANQRKNRGLSFLVEKLKNARGKQNPKDKPSEVIVNSHETGGGAAIKGDKNVQKKKGSS